MAMKELNQMNPMVLEESDWVKGKSMTGALFHGYIESMNTYSDLVKVRVIESDNELIMGKSIEAMRKSLSSLSDVPFRDADDVRSLINLALQTKDEEWFQELTEQLSSYQQDKKSRHQSKVNQTTNKTINQNRISNK